MEAGQGQNAAVRGVKRHYQEPAQPSPAPGAAAEFRALNPRPLYKITAVAGPAKS